LIAEVLDARILQAEVPTAVPLISYVDRFSARPGAPGYPQPCQLIGAHERRGTGRSYGAGGEGMATSSLH
jgi:hypothetical protein